MRIAVVSTPFVSVPPKGYGGTELFCGTLTDALVARGHSVTLFATGDSHCDGELRALYSRASWPPSPAVERAHVRWALFEIARAHEPYDVIQINSPLAIRAGVELGLGPALVHTLHHQRDEALSRIYSEHPQIRYVAISRRQRDLEVFLPRITVIYHGLAARHYPPEARPDPRRPRYATHIGRFAAEKGTHLAILAAIEARTSIVVAGRCHENRDDRRYYHREVEPLLSHPLVHNVGEADLPRKLELLQNAKALLCPILWEEPFGLIAIEAMMVGTPVIGFRHGSFPEIVDEGVTGFLVEDIGHMTEQLRCLEGFNRQACAERARERFSADRLAADYERVFEECAHESLGAAEATGAMSNERDELGPEVATGA